MFNINHIQDTIDINLQKHGSSLVLKRPYIKPNKLAKNYKTKTHTYIQIPQNLELMFMYPFNTRLHKALETTLLMRR